jgi:hypothetical protein
LPRLKEISATILKNAGIISGQLSPWTQPDVSTSLTRRGQVTAAEEDMKAIVG